MTTIDFLFLIIILVSVIVSLWRGFVREIFSLGGWIISFWVATRFSSPLANFLEDYIEAYSFRVILSYVVLFVITMLLAAAANNLLSQLVERANLSSTDRAIGAIFGVFRGFVILVMLVTLGGITPFPKDDWWQESAMMPSIQSTAIWVQETFLPKGFASRFVYD